MSAITIGGDLIHYEKLGRGRPVILAHGWLGSWRYWIPLMQTLHLRYSVYTLDLVGFGDSAKNPDRYAVDYQADVLRQFMDQLGIPKAAFIGHGLGAMVGVHFALQNPSRIARLLLASLPLFDPGDLKERVPAGTRVMLTSRDRYSLAPHLDETVESASNQNDASANGEGDTPFHELPTIGRINPIDRQQLVNRARQITEAQQSNGQVSNPLQEAFSGRKLTELLERCFKRSDPIYERMRPDVDKTDARTLLASTQTFEAGRMLDDIRRITAPTVLVHGKEDPILAKPSEDILSYLTYEKEDVLVPILLDGVRHFPMLELEAFPRLTTDFLDTATINELEVRGRWLRRNR
jgi:pimeloyl-ACP methyl ester carboxylesterase